MIKKTRKNVTTVREHPRHVPVSNKNPDGITIVDQHIRRLHGTFLDTKEIETIVANYDRKNITYPTQDRLGEYKNSDKYDELIAIWTDYFNKKFNANPKLDPDVVKALIASESRFKVDPRNNPVAIGIAQITKETHRILQDPKGETKEFIFSGIRQKDLKTPEIAIPMAVRWLFRKQQTAASKLKRAPTEEEIILEYKGLLRSNTKYKNKALANFRKNYALLKAK
jgi:hypothetical protein